MFRALEVFWGGKGRGDGKRGREEKEGGVSG